MTTEGPFFGGHYKCSTGYLKQPEKPHTEIWFYRTGERFEFHTDIYDGEEYRGHITFQLPRSRVERPRKAKP